MNDTLVVIPARYASTRFPGKPLALIHGVPMVIRVIQQVLKVQGLDAIVATDHGEIYDTVTAAGFQAVMTADSHQSGTDRCAEAVTKTQGNYQYIINVQGDEPFIQPQQIEEVQGLLMKTDVDIATLVKEISDDQAQDPNKVKCVFSVDGRALYFSRACIPYQRMAREYPYFKHLGIYGFRREVLFKLVALPQSGLELTESLEQLRWLENGYSIHVAKTALEAMAVDTPADLEKVLATYPITDSE